MCVFFLECTILQEECVSVIYIYICVCVRINMYKYSSLTFINYISLCISKDLRSFES